MQRVMLHALHSLLQLCPLIEPYLQQIPKNSWMTSYFAVPKCGVCTSNMADAYIAKLVRYSYHLFKILVGLVTLG